MQLQRGSFKQQMKVLHKLHNEVEQALAVLDKETGKLLNYRQLLVHPKYKKVLIFVCQVGNNDTKRLDAKRAYSNFFCMEFLCLYLYVIYLNVGEDTFDRDDVRRSQQVDVYMFIVCVLPPTTELFQLDS